MNTFQTTSVTRRWPAMLLFLQFTYSAFAQQLQVENPVRILALGDSYTIGQSVDTSARWPAQLRDSLSVRGITTETLRIIATTGWRTDNLLNAIAGQQLDLQQYNFVSLLIGVNNQYQGRPFSQYRAEFRALLDSAVRYAGGNKSHVVVFSIPDYAFTPYGQQSGNPEQISSELDTYNAFNRHIADSMQITYIDITPVSRLGIQQPEYVAGDGLHPSGRQYTEWVKLLLQKIDDVSTGNHPASQSVDLVTALFPNPATDFLSVKQKDTQPMRFEIYTLTGHRLKSGMVEGSRISISDLAYGVYVVKVMQKDSFRYLKFIRSGY